MKALLNSFLVAISMSTSIFAKDKDNPPPPIFIAAPYASEPVRDISKDSPVTATITTTVNTNGTVTQIIEREVVRYVPVTNIVYQPSAPVWSNPVLPPQYVAQPEQPFVASSRIPYPTIAYTDSQPCYSGYGGGSYAVDMGFRFGGGSRGGYHQNYAPVRSVGWNVVYRNQGYHQPQQHYRPSYPASQGVGWNVIYRH